MSDEPITNQWVFTITAEAEVIKAEDIKRAEEEGDEEEGDEEG